MAELVLVALFAYLVWRFFIRNRLAKRRADQWPSQAEPPAAPAKLSGAAWDTSKNKSDSSSGWNTVSYSERPIGGGLSVSVGAYTREYDHNKYRFDGTAHPQFRIKYIDEDGSTTTREIYVDRWRKSSGVTRYECWCFLRDEKRTFRSDRMLEIVNLDTNRKIKDISTYRARY